MKHTLTGNVLLGKIQFLDAKKNVIFKVYLVYYRALPFDNPR